MSDEKPGIIAGSDSDRIAPPLSNVPNRLPAVVQSPPPTRLPRRDRWRLPVVGLLLAAVAGGGIYGWRHAQTVLPPGFSWSNGRLEADAIDIDTKFAGRIAKLLVDEGDMVSAGQLVALMDTRDLEASLKKDQSVVSQAERTLDEARANLEQQQTVVKLAKRELDR